MTWKVERWGGNANHKWRVVFAGDEDKARERYHRIYLELYHFGSGVSGFRPLRA